ncbi:1590_t:CDS:2 [Acaulospora colombiana]|uniref:1590_t:CDS:1 n=1 Tax=Acaulospora colombiana TaxID=27376 RepID=A0ACA9LIU7_9GLOM|nr:1590_t:CDS:2 [Acaulospora colombiana]
MLVLVYKSCIETSQIGFRRARIDRESEKAPIAPLFQKAFNGRHKCPLNLEVTLGLVASHSVCHATLDKSMAQSPMIDAKTSTTSMRTNKVGSAASEIAAVEPVMPTAIPQKRLQRPTVRPPQNRAKPSEYSATVVRGKEVP